MCDRVYSWLVIVFGFLENPDKKNYLPPLFLLMFIGTTEAGTLLGVSSARVRTLLIQGRIQGAYKISNVWIIPLVNGMPVISPGRAGPRPRTGDGPGAGRAGPRGGGVAPPGAREDAPELTGGGRVRGV